MDDHNPMLQDLRRLLASGEITQAVFDQLTGTLGRDSVAAIGEDAKAVGERGMIVGDHANGTFNTGTLIQYIKAGRQPGASADALRKAYLARLMRQCDQVSLMAGDERAGQLRLSRVYTALLTTEQRIESDDFGRREKAPYLSVVDQLNRESKLALLGDPGGGKTSVAHILALAMAGELLGSPDDNLATLTIPIQRRAEEETPAPQHWDHGALLPVRIVLRELATELPDADTAIDANTLLGHVERQLQAAGLGEFLPHLKRELLELGGLILLDGLDEVPDAQDRRVRIKRAVETFAQTFQRCRYLATSRTYAYQQQDWKLQGFAETQLLPFQPWQIEAFVTAWYGQMTALQRLTAVDAEDRAARLTTAAVNNPRIRELAERPLLLTLIAKLQTEKGGNLPEQPEELYARAVDLLLDEWESTKPRRNANGSTEPEPSLAEYLRVGRDRIRKVLDQLAFEAHRDQAEATGTANIAGERLVAALLAAAQDPDAKPQRLTDYLSHRAGLLNEHGNGVYQFPHRTFQEYLAACHLTDDDFPDQLAKLAKQDPQRWREVVRLAAAKAGRGSAASVWLLAETLCPEDVDGNPEDTALPLTETDAWGALLAGQVLSETVDLDRIAKRDESKRERIRDWQLAILRRQALPAVERALAGRSLDALGDPRPEVMTLDGMQFCYVPAGPFWMGDDADDNAKPMHQVDLPAFWIARHPVTVAQWREYVTTSRHRPGDRDSLLGAGNAPALWISWHEALACCRWLSVRWAKHLPSGWRVALPSEAEWEKAARGGLRIPSAPCISVIGNIASAAPQSLRDNIQPQREYPWDIHGHNEDLVNVEHDIGGANAIGVYPQGHSPIGCEDLSGNVWDWTRSLWGEDWQKPAHTYPYRPDEIAREVLSADDSVMRIVRGGCWSAPRFAARCASRVRVRPDGRYGGLGFRVVLCCSPVR
ncbi:SUMF1/EgtB/PvdO family nonheme iron enzyme [Lysobacter hankyongensis]|uniref:NACHT domain-containing protein n=1 Tax=Lysobacter hankyongensis TaxID=1176535 RepID=A0ABP9APL3_9GAMM